MIKLNISESREFKLEKIHKKISGIPEIKSPKTKEIIDIALIVYFPSNLSITGEDLAEFHVHGGKAVVKALQDAISAVENCRIAER